MLTSSVPSYLNIHKEEVWKDKPTKKKFTRASGPRSLGEGYTVTTQPNQVPFGTEELRVGGAEEAAGGLGPAGRGRPFPSTPARGFRLTEKVRRQRYLWPACPATTGNVVGDRSVGYLRLEVAVSGAGGRDPSGG